MAIKKIYIENFKCFETVLVELNQFNIVIGPNASGKSNFIRILRFLKDFYEYGLENAISLQGGSEFFQNINIGPNKNFKLILTVDHPGERSVPSANQYILELISIDYELEVKFFKDSSQFEIVHEKVIQYVNILERITSDSSETHYQEIGAGTLEVMRDGNSVVRDFNPPAFSNIPKDMFDFSAILPMDQPIEKDKSAFFPATASPFVLYPFFSKILNNIQVYDFDPRLLKRAIPFTGRTELAEDGGNLTIILNSILKSEENNKKFTNLLKDVLPFIVDTKTETQTDISYIFKMKEGYENSQGKYLPSTFLSDGTVNIITLIVALFFQREDIIAVIEEPERNLHPMLISKLVDLMRESAKKRQIIITTHNPEFLRHSSLDDLHFVKRNYNGFATIIRPSKLEHVKSFLQNDVGIDELFIQNLIH